jgi:hypothetical protein
MAYENYNQMLHKPDTANALGGYDRRRLEDDRRQADDAHRRREALDRAVGWFRGRVSDALTYGEEVPPEDIVDLLAAIAAHGGEAGSSALRQFQSEAGGAQDSRPLSMWGHDRLERRRRARDNEQYGRREGSLYPDRERGQLGVSDRGRHAHDAHPGFTLTPEQQWAKVDEQKFRHMFGDQAANITKINATR